MTRVCMICAILRLLLVLLQGCPSTNLAGCSDILRRGRQCAMLILRKIRKGERLT